MVTRTPHNVPRTSRFFPHKQRSSGHYRHLVCVSRLAHFCVTVLVSEKVCWGERIWTSDGESDKRMKEIQRSTLWSAMKPSPEYKVSRVYSTHGMKNNCIQNFIRRIRTEGRTFKIRLLSGLSMRLLKEMREPCACRAWIS
jgi:hypothetical protein